MIRHQWEATALADFCLDLELRLLAVPANQPRQHLAALGAARLSFPFFLL